MSWDYALYARKFEEHSPLWDEGKVSGDCFERAGFFMMANSDREPIPILVHAEVRHTETGEWIDHAWCEIMGEGTFEDGSTGPVVIVVDGTQPDPNARFIPKETHAELVAIRNRREYTFAQLVANAFRYGTDGPWPT